MKLKDLKVGAPVCDPDDPLKARIERGLYKLLAVTVQPPSWDADRAARWKAMRTELRANIEVALKYLAIKNRAEEKPPAAKWGAGFGNGKKGEDAGERDD